MPARTLSPLVAADPQSLSPTRLRMYSPPHRPQRRDSHDGRRQQTHAQDNHTPYEPSARQSSTLVHTNHNPLVNRDHGRSHPPPMQRTSYAHWHAAQSASFPYPSNQHSAALMTGWLPHPPRMTRLPPPILHKVWILDCQSCGTFLTNRGMKVSVKCIPAARNIQFGYKL